MRAPRWLAAGLAAFALHAAAAPAAERVVYTSDGYAVGVEWAPEYGPEPAQEQWLTGVLDHLLHGSEMGLVHISVVTPPGVAAVCGPGALACYQRDRITIPGARVPGGAPLEFLLAHEYAHHILNHRRNDPWRAQSWGAKRWATARDVCAAVRRGQLFDDYAGIPGEAFAETYAMMHYPQLHYPWGFSGLLAPDDRAEEAVRRDVAQPWAGPSLRTYTGRLGRGHARTRTLAVPLDGTARVTVTSTPRVSLEVIVGGAVVRRVAARRGKLRATTTICGRRRLRVRLIAVRGSGPYSILLSRP